LRWMRASVRIDYSGQKQIDNKKPVKVRAFVDYVLSWICFKPAEGFPLMIKLY